MVRLAFGRVPEGALVKVKAREAWQRRSRSTITRKPRRCATSAASARGCSATTAAGAAALKRIVELRQAIPKDLRGDSSQTVFSISTGRSWPRSRFLEAFIISMPTIRSPAPMSRTMSADTRLLSTC